MLAYLSAMMEFGWIARLLKFLAHFFTKDTITSCTLRLFVIAEGIKWYCRKRFVLGFIICALSTRHGHSSVRRPVSVTRSNVPGGVPGG